MVVEVFDGILQEVFGFVIQLRIHPLGPFEILFLFLSKNDFVLWTPIFVLKPFVVLFYKQLVGSCLVQLVSCRENLEELLKNQDVVVI